MIIKILLRRRKYYVKNAINTTENAKKRKKYGKEHRYWSIVVGSHKKGAQIVRRCHYLTA